MIDVFKHFKGLQKENVILSFQGKVTFDLVKSILDIIEARLDILGEDLKTKRKVYNVLVESLQNLAHHVEILDDKKGDKSMASIMISTNAKGYVVDTGNFVQNQTVNDLNSRLETINATDKDELRKMHKEVLGNLKFSSKGGGGLGFLDIARKSGSKLNYSIKKVDTLISFFHLNVQITKD